MSNVVRLQFKKTVWGLPWVVFWETNIGLDVGATDDVLGKCLAQLKSIKHSKKAATFEEQLRIIPFNKMV